MKNQFTFIKRIYGYEMNQVNKKFYSSKEEAKNAGIIWMNENTKYLGVVTGRNYEVIELK